MPSLIPYNQQTMREDSQKRWQTGYTGCEEENNIKPQALYAETVTLDSDAYRKHHTLHRCREVLCSMTAQTTDMLTDYVGGWLLRRIGMDSCL